MTVSKLSSFNSTFHVKSLFLFVKSTYAGNWISPEWRSVRVLQTTSWFLEHSFQTKSNWIYLYAWNHSYEYTENIDTSSLLKRKSAWNDLRHEGSEVLSLEMQKHRKENYDSKTAEWLQNWPAKILTKSYLLKNFCEQKKWIIWTKIEYKLYTL